MQSIGERLEEARKRRGISIREASEATKIRGDFLLSFENSQTDIGLPEVYVRGFLRNYANFLKIDAETIVTDFNALKIAESKAARRDSRELFGRMEIPAQKTARESEKREAKVEKDSDDENFSRTFLTPKVMNHLKIALIISAGIIVVLVIVLLMRAIIGAATTPTAPEPAGGAAERVDEQVETETITLVALGNVKVKVAEVDGNRELFDGPMVEGETRRINKRGRVLITYDAGRNLNVEKDEQRYRMSTDGIGRSWFD